MIETCCLQFSVYSFGSIRIALKWRFLSIDTPECWCELVTVHLCQCPMSCQQKCQDDFVYWAPKTLCISWGFTKICYSSVFHKTPNSKSYCNRSIKLGAIILADMLKHSFTYLEPQSLCCLNWILVTQDSQKCHSLSDLGFGAKWYLTVTKRCFAEGV